jgi:hypothetical protein
MLIIQPTDPTGVIGAIIGLAALVQSLTGFGFALVAVSLLPWVIDLRTAVPLTVLISLAGNVVLSWHYRHHFEWPVVLRLLLAALIAIPLGVLGLKSIPAAVALRCLGLLILTYVVYDGCRLPLPKLSTLGWTYLFGGLSGLLTGAFSTGGPPVVIYASARRWSPAQFRGNLSGFFLASSVIAIGSHSWQGNLTPLVLRSALQSLPWFALGLGLGLVLSRWIDGRGFRPLVQLLLLLTGAWLFFSG